MIINFITKIQEKWRKKYFLLVLLLEEDHSCPQLKKREKKKHWTLTKVSYCYLKKIFQLPLPQAMNQELFLCEFFLITFLTRDTICGINERNRRSLLIVLFLQMSLGQCFSRGINAWVEMRSYRWGPIHWLILGAGVASIHAVTSTGMRQCLLKWISGALFICNQSMVPDFPRAKVYLSIIQSFF